MLETDVILVHRVVVSDYRNQPTADAHMRRPVQLKILVKRELSQDMVKDIDIDLNQEGEKPLLDIRIGSDHARVELPYRVDEKQTQATIQDKRLQVVLGVVKGGELEPANVPIQPFTPISEPLIEEESVENEPIPEPKPASHPPSPPRPPIVPTGTIVFDKACAMCNGVRVTSRFPFAFHL